MRVTYHHSLYGQVSEWVCPEHQGFPRSKSCQWFARRGVMPAPETVEKALIAAELCVWPAKITVGQAGKYDEIIAYSNWQKPEPAGKNGLIPF